MEDYILLLMLILWMLSSGNAGVGMGSRSWMEEWCIAVHEKSWGIG